MEKKRKKHYSESELNKILPDNVSKKYKFIVIEKHSTTKFISPKYGLIDLNKITLQKVEHLVKLKCPYFVKK